MKENIISDNAKLGLETRFFNEKGGVLGFVENGIVYLNEAYEDLDKINRHEVLHNFVESESFKFIQIDLFALYTKEEFENIKREYYLRYAGLYSEEEIENGVLNDEIAIDMIIGNGDFKKEAKEIAKGMYEIITSGEMSENVAKRYLNLSLTNKIEQQFPQLTTWEKLFVLNFYDGKDKILPTQKETKYNKVREDINKALDELYAYAENSENFKISIENNPELEREFASELKALESRGQGSEAEYFRNHKRKELSQLAEKFAQSQQAEFKHIVDFIKTTQYEPAFKYLMLAETLAKTYKQEKDNEGTKTIVKRRETHKTLAGHMTMNDAVLRVIYNNLKDYTNFANLYFAGLAVYNEKTAKKSEVSLDGVDTFGMGKWLKFEGKQSNEKEYVKNAQALSSLVQNTPWCTKQLASTHLEQGDFFVFVDNSGQPHIAVKMDGNEIDEVRGIKNGNEQALEDDYRKVAIEFLTKNKDITYGKEWLEKEEWNARLVRYVKEIEEDSFSEEEAQDFVFDVYEFKDYKAHFQENSNRDKLKKEISKNKKLRELVAKSFGLKPNEICFAKITDEMKNFKLVLGTFESWRWDKKQPLTQIEKIYGAANFTNVSDLGNLKTVLGEASFSFSPIVSLGKLEFIGDDAKFTSSQVTSLGNLETIGRDAHFEFSYVTDLGNLKTIGGYAFFIDSQIISLGKLETIGGGANFTDSKITDLGNLQTIGGNVYFDNSQVTSLSNLGSIGGFVSFSNSQITKLGNLKTIGDEAVFTDSKITDLGNLQLIGGNAYFKDSQLTSLGNLESIGGFVSFSNSQITKLGNLKTIGDNANFTNSKITDLGNLQTIGGTANFESSKITDLGNLQSIGGDAYFWGSQITDLGNLQSIGGNVYFDNSQVTSLGNLESIGGDLILNCSKVVDLGKLKYVGGEIFLDEEQKELFADKIYEKDGHFYFKNEIEIENEGELE